ncbi:MAG TPA: hypothetical protein HA348_06495 [Thermoplasmata archaeon]|nr:hypothetical protein [Thermoplasmata archaeon]
MKFLRAILLSLSLLCCVFLTQAVQPTIILIEKNVLRNEGDTLIINHNEFVESDKRVVVKIRAIIPEEYYNPDQYPMIFGIGAVLKDEFYINTKNPKAVEGTKISLKEKNVEYEWGVEVEPGQVAIVAYENYYGKMSSLYKGDAINLGNLKILEKWNTKKDGKIDIEYRLKNVGKSEIYDFSFLLFLPEGEISQEPLAEFCNTYLSENLLLNKGFYSIDGMGRIMKGIGVEAKGGLLLQPNEEIRFVISTNLELTRPGKISPTLAVNHRQWVDGLRLGFESLVQPEINQKRFIEGSSIILRTPCIELTSGVKIEEIHEK